MNRKSFLQNRINNGFVNTITNNQLSYSLDKNLEQYKISGNSVQRNLPSLYQQVDYIESVGYQRIDTGHIPTTETRIKTDIQITQLSDDEIGNSIFGSKWDIDGFILLQVIILNQSKNIFRWHNGDWADSGDIVNTSTKYSLDVYKGTVIINGNTEINMSTGVGSDSSIKIFSFDSTKKSYFKLFNFKIYENNTLISDYIPCYRKSDNVIGLYDIVKNEFKTNVGSGTFSKGANSTPTESTPIEVKSVGDKSFVWNQLLTQGTINWSETNTQSSIVYRAITSAGNLISGHKYFFNGATSYENISLLYVNISGQNDLKNGGIFTATSTSGAGYILAGIVANKTGRVVFEKNIVDLTVMYGAGNEPTDINQIRNDCKEMGHNLSVSQPKNTGTQYYKIQIQQFDGRYWGKLDLGTLTYTGSTVCRNYVRDLSGLDMGTDRSDWSTPSDCYIENNSGKAIRFSTTGECDGNPAPKNIDGTIVIGLPTRNYSTYMTVVAKDYGNFNGGAVKAALTGTYLYYPLASAPTPIVQPTIKNIYITAPLRKIDTYADYIDYERSKVVRNVGSVDLGTLNWRSAWTNAWYTDELAGVAIANENVSATTVGMLTEKYRNASPILGDVGTFNIWSSAAIEGARLGVCTGSTTETPSGMLYYELLTQTEESEYLPKIRANKGKTIFRTLTEVQPSEMLVKYRSNVKE